MSGCTHPQIRLETWERYKNQQGKWSYKANFIWTEKGKHISNIQKDAYNLLVKGNYRKFDIIPCGKCIGCFLERARDKAVQLSLEKMNPEYKENECWFITLTYDDDYLPIHTYEDETTGEQFSGCSTELKDLQNWIKKLRDNHPDKNIRYMAAREYGSTTLRPHYHVIIFGLPLDPELFVKVGNNANGDPLWTTPQLDNIMSRDCWSVRRPIGDRTAKMYRAGNIIIGEVTFQSISYVARYTMKKANKEMNNEWWYKAQGLDIEGISQSQDLGKWYYDLHKHEIYKNDLVPVLGKNGNFSKPPKSFDKRYKKEYPEKYKEVVQRRKEKMLNNMLQEEQQTDMDYLSILESKELKDKQFKDIRSAI